MVWIFLAAVIAFVLGGVMAVKPTKAQKYIAEIRETAIQSGLHIKLPVSLRFPDNIEKGRSPYYCRRLKNKELQGRFYCVSRHGQGVGTSSGDLSTSLKTAIDQVLITASPAIEGFYLGEGLFGFSWHESDKQEIFDELCACLDRVESLLAAQI